MPRAPNREECAMPRPPLPWEPHDHGRARWDAIVVGARAAGAATALLLARTGRSVLVVDRAAYGSDTVSTHALMRTGVVQLHRWGLLDRIVAAGTPAIRSTTFHFADGSVPVQIKPGYGVDALYAPRRTVLDRVLVDAAREAGAVVQHGVTVTGLVRDGSGRVSGIVAHDDEGHPVPIRADLVVGADGAGSRVAAQAGAATTLVAPSAAAVAYRYFADVEVDGYEWHYGHRAYAGAIPTNTGVCTFVSVPADRWAAEVAPDVARGFWSILGELSTDLAARCAAGTPVERFRRFPGRPGHLRRAGGRGWALVGDAGSFKDPCSAHGVSDALRDAELLVRALEAHPSEPAALRAYERERDALSLDVFRITERIASFRWTTAEIRALTREMATSMVAELEAFVGQEVAGRAVAVRELSEAV
jgi:2-polyprenyl-6-methoxyphenol hydroxylase-like FAD-dependent oxidoreductase